jgi:hypothetical protein
MPVIIEGDEEVEVSEARRQSLVNQVIADKKDRHLDAVHEAGQGTPIWDCIEQIWTAPMPSFDLTHYLNKIVAKCSVCFYTSSRAGFVPTHIRQIVEAQTVHVGATVTPIMGSPGFQCSGCGNSFISRPMNGLKHLGKVEAEALEHTWAYEQILKRFSLGPSELVILEEHNKPLVAVMGPEASQVERSSVPQVANRRRKRNRSRR